MRSYLPDQHTSIILQLSKSADVLVPCYTATVDSVVPSHGNTENDVVGRPRCGNEKERGSGSTAELVCC